MTIKLTDEQVKIILDTADRIAELATRCDVYSDEERAEHEQSLAAMFIALVLVQISADAAEVSR